MDIYVDSLKNAPIKKIPPGSKPVFYVCSYGGCGSTMLTKFLSQYGTTYHVHSAQPPTKLTHPIDTTYIDNFSSVPVPESELSRCKVIYIFRNPTHAQISVYGEYHRAHLELPNPEKYPNTLAEYALAGVDTLKYKQHYLNYMKFESRNYQIIGVNYHKLWDRDTLEELFWALQLPPGAILKFPHKAERTHNTPTEIVDALNVINTELIDIINASPGIQYY